MTPRRRWVQLAMIGLGIPLAWQIIAPSAALGQPPARAPRARTIYHKSRSFRIPFNVDAADQPRLKEVQLWVSEDAGYNWKPKSIATPERPSFTFRAPRDAEFWFTVRTLDKQGKLYPADDDQIEPRLKVIVDTKEPSLVLEPDPRRGSTASVRWEIRDEHLDLSSLVVEYQAEGAREWRQVPIRRPALLGSETWDAGTAEALRVRASVADRAGNTAETSVTLSEGAAANPALADGIPPEFNTPPPISQISTGPSFPPVDESYASAEPSREVVPSRTRPPANSAPPPDAFGNGEPQAAPANTMPVARNRTLLVASPQFPLQYAVDDAGPNGPSTVELWVTQDGGRTWIRRSEDNDRTSPYPVDLGGEGTFGISLVARSASGLGDQPPAPGDPPQTWVEVDSTAPNVKLYPVQVGTGRHVGKVAIIWEATDAHLGSRPVVLLWRSDSTDAQWQTITEPLENKGKFVWVVPTNMPPRFHVRVEVTDTMGHKAFADTTASDPIIVDRTRPRSRIIGLDPSARTGLNPSEHPFR